MFCNRLSVCPLIESILVVLSVLFQNIFFAFLDCIFFLDVFKAIFLEGYFLGSSSSKNSSSSISSSKNSSSSSSSSSSKNSSSSSSSSGSSSSSSFVMMLQG